jgi:hypothetical protein
MADPNHATLHVEIARQIGQLLTAIAIAWLS